MEDKSLLIANKNLEVIIQKEEAKFLVVVNGQKALKADGKDELVFTTLEEAELHANKQYVHPFLEKKLNEFLAISYPAIITGAGSSLSDSGNLEEKLGLLMSELWDTAETEVKDFTKFAESLGIKKADGIEKLLSKAQMKYVVDPETISLTTIQEIEQHIVSKCTLTLPDNSAHETLFQKLSNRHSHKPRIGLFTLNYDDLFEQAAIKTGTVLLDGFSFSQPRYFHSNNFNLDIVYRENSRIKNEGNFLRCVVQLLKLHGSINWYEEGDRTVQQPSTTKGNRKLIFPRDTKYEQTYKQPFFEMMAQFQQHLRKENSFLIIVGYSFQDTHINSVIKEALITNPTLQLLVVNPNIKKEGDDFRSYLYQKVVSTSRITIWSAKFSDLVNLMPDRMYISPEEQEKL